MTSITCRVCYCDMEPRRIERYGRFVPTAAGLCDDCAEKQVARVLARSRIPTRLRGMTLREGGPVKSSSIPGKAKRQSRIYVTRERAPAVTALRELAPGGAVTMLGPVGTGKSQLAAALAEDWAKLRRSVLWVREEDLVQIGEEGERLRKEAEGVALLILDEVGTVGSPWAVRCVEAQIVSRYDAVGALVVISNLQLDGDGKTLEDAYGCRAVSRLVEMGPMFVVGGDDWRRS